MTARARLGPWPVWLVLGAALASCSHDLDKLRHGNPGALRDGGSGGSGGGAGTAGSADEGPGVCAPCEAPSAAAERLGLRSCCRGATQRECGLTFGEGSLCLPRDVPGIPDQACPTTTADGTRFTGCCRPDARCGLSAAAVGLGCVARDEILPALTSAVPELVECRYACEVDGDCGLLPGDFVCAEDPAGSGDRFCADACQRDLDCRRWTDRVCALANDVARNRVLSICRTPVGDVQPGERCTAADDCLNGVCLAVSASEGICSELCRNGADCASRRCVSSDIPRPMRGTGTEKLLICDI
jgi:hypothetical protein